MHGTFLEIDLNKITENSRRVKEVCDIRNIEVLGVTKGFSAIPRIVRAMTEGGIDKLADSRLENISSLREAGFNNHMTLLRIPMLSSVKKVIALADCSLNSELQVMEALSDMALNAGTCHDVVLMIDVGDLREGIMPDEARKMAKKAAMLKGIRIRGIGTNMGCYGGILPTENNIALLSAISIDLQNELGIRFDILSGGGTSSLKLVKEGAIPSDVNQLRVGEGILLGRDSTRNAVIPWLHHDTFLLSSEIVEVKEKPSVPVGEVGRDAFGNIPQFQDKGIRKRAIVAIGQQDVALTGIFPADPGILLLGASSDHMILDISDAQASYHVGDQVCFCLNYQGLVGLCSSNYVKHVFKR